MWTARDACRRAGPFAPRTWSGAHDPHAAPGKRRYRIESPFGRGTPRSLTSRSTVMTFSKRRHAMIDFSLSWLPFVVVAIWR